MRWIEKNIAYDNRIKLALGARNVVEQNGYQGRRFAADYDYEIEPALVCNNKVWRGPGRPIPLLHPRGGEPCGGSGDRSGELTVRIDYGPVAGKGTRSDGTMDRLLQAPLDGKISEATYNRSLDAMTRGEISLNQR